MPSEILIVRHGTARLGIDLAHVREILRMLAPTPLPGAPPGVLGAVNLRGETIPLIDLEARLPAGAGVAGIDHHVVVIDPDQGSPIAIVVSRAEDIVEVPPDAWRDTREVLRGSALRGVVKLGPELVPVIDPEALLADGEVETLERLLEQLEEHAS